MAKLFADAGVICIASLISPYRRDRDACRALLPDGDFIEVGTSQYYYCFCATYNFGKRKMQIEYLSGVMMIVVKEP